MRTPTLAMVALAAVVAVLVPSVAAAVTSVWSGDFETGGLKQYTEVLGIGPEPGTRISLDPTNPVTQGVYSSRVELRSGDVATRDGTNRVQLRNSPWSEGQDLYFRWSVYIDPSTTIGASFSNPWRALVAWPTNQNGACSPMKFFLQRDNGHNADPNGLDSLVAAGDLGVCGANDVTQWRLVNPVEGAWYTFLTHIRFSSDPSVGLFEFWLKAPDSGSFTKQTFGTGAQTLQIKTLGAAGNTANMRVGDYRNSSFTTTDILYFDDVYACGSFDACVVPAEKPPSLAVSPANLSFAAPEDGPPPPAQTVTVSNAGGGTLDWTAGSDVPWLDVSPASGTNSGTVTVTPSTAGLTAGTYSGNVTVTAPGVSGSPQTVPVTLTVKSASPALAVSPSTLAFRATQGGADPAAKALTVSNGGGGTLDWTAAADVPWLDVSPAGGTDGGSISVTPHLSGLSAGTFTGNVTVTAPGAGGSPQTVLVTLTVDPPPPALSVSPSSLSFRATQGGANPAAQTLSATNAGGGRLDVTASGNASWLSVTPSTATAPATVTVAPSVSGLLSGTYTATVTVTATTTGATGSPNAIPVTLVVDPVPNLVGAWAFDESSGNTVTDYSGRGNTGTISGATRTTGGKFGGALTFSGANNWVLVPDANSLDLSTGMTVEAWVRPSAIGTRVRAVLLKERSGGLVYALDAGDGSGRAATHVFTTADLALSGTATTGLNAWTNLAATYDGANLRLYVNGVQAASRALAGSIQGSTGALRIGGASTLNNQWFAGVIDEVRLYNRALNATEVLADMNKRVKP
jgi:hypothetical protein